MKPSIAIAVAGALAAPLPLLADGTPGTEAPVVAVTPVIQTIPTRRHECWSEPARTHGRERVTRGGYVYHEVAPVERNVPRCGTVHGQQQVTSAYDVRFVYDGREFVTRMAQHPGATVTIGVDVPPLG